MGRSRRDVDERRSDCPIACTLDLIGDRWTLVVLRDLFAGKSRFDELASAEQIATNILSERLARLEREGMLDRASDPDDARRAIYTLTARGRSLAPVLQAVATWGLEHVRGTRMIAELSRPAAPSRRARAK
jgi:DNA-binding HxlR family transcriptional regulator